MRSYNRLNLVVVNYNNTDYTAQLIKSLSDNLDFINEIVVVDNASSHDERQKLIDIKQDKLKILMLNDNIGYFPGLNKGLEELSSLSECPTIVGNNDLVFKSDFFKNFLKLDLPDSVLVISPSLITKDGVYQNPAQINKPSPFRRIFYWMYFSNYHLGIFIYYIWRKLGLSSQSKIEKDNFPKPIFIGMGAAYILLPNFFLKNSNLEYPFFLYGEEAFLSKQVENSGGILWYEPSLEITHLESVATSKMPSKEKYFLMKKAYNVYKNYFR